MRKPLKNKNILILGLSVCFTSNLYSQEQSPTEEKDETAEKHIVTGKREKIKSKGATGLDLSIFDTPQSIVPIDREILDTFAFDDISSSLRYANGVSVESVETDRTSFFSRGFEIKYMQIDGVNLPVPWNLNGSLDTSIYESLEVIRGANGLLTGTGAPSGTINFIRKRPKSDLYAAAEVTLNTYNGQRIEADVSTPLTSDGRWAARVVGTYSDEKSWIDRYENDRTLFYGVIDGQLLDNLTLMVGYIDQKSDSTNPLWGALPVIYSDGTQTDYDVSASQAMDWTYWNTHYKTAFAELNLALSKSWEVKGTFTHTKYEQAQETIWYEGIPDRETGLGLSGYPGGYSQDFDTNEIDLIATGTFSVLDREHQLVLGYGHSKLDSIDTNKLVPEDDPIWGPAPAFDNGYKGNEIPRPGFPAPNEVSDVNNTLIRYYGSTRLNPADAWKVILGFSQFEMKSDGLSYGEPQDASESRVSPYAGIIWSPVPTTNVYLSYSDIYQPQTELNQENRALGPAKGLNYEFGAKTELFNKKLLAALALFRAEQKNLAEYEGSHEETSVSYYKGSNINSEGIEVDVTGYITNQLKILAGFSTIKLRESDGTKRTYLPRDSFKLLSTLDLSDQWNLGASLRWQDEIYYTSSKTSTRVSQDAYAVLGLTAGYNMNQHFSMSVILDNLTDEKYYNSFYWADIYDWDQAYYGAPRNGKLALNVRW